MKKLDKGLLRKLLLGCVYAAGAALIVASGGSGSGSSGFVCKLDVGAIAPASDGSEDIWVGVVSTASGQQFNSVARLDGNGLEKIGVSVGSGDDNTVRTIAVAADGSNNIYVGGDFAEGIFRLKPDGTLDTAFDVGTGFNGSVLKIIPVANGSGAIYVAGDFSSYNGAVVSGFVRLNADGSRDTNFTAITQPVQDMAMAEDPGIVPDLDYVYSGSAGSYNLARWFPSGSTSPDPAFSPVPVSPVYSILPALDGTGTLYAGGGFSEQLIRLFRIGTEDTSFSIGSGFDGDVRRLLRADDGSGNIYVAGEFTTFQGSPAGGLVRLQNDGALDTSFNIGTGFTGSDGPAPFSDLAAIALAPGASGDVYVGGDYQNYKGTASNGLVRLNSDATLDPVFEVRVSHGDEECSNATLP